MRLFKAFAAVVGAILPAGLALAEEHDHDHDHAHVDIFIARDAANRLFTGAADLDHGQYTIGQRVYGLELDEFLASTSPGFVAVAASSVPAGYLPLPPATLLFVDIVPHTISTLSANLFYWDGAGEVAFGAVPEGTTFHLQRLSPAQDFAADGTNTTLAGFRVAQTTAAGAIHWHPNYLLDGPGAAAPADGIYLMPFQMSMSGLSNSDTAFLVINKGMSEQVHEQAMDYVATSVVPEPASIGLVLGAALLCLRRRR